MISPLEAFLVITNTDSQNAHPATIHFTEQDGHPPIRHWATSQESWGMFFTVPEMSHVDFT